MSFLWALTSHNKIRSTWTDAIALYASTENAAYPKENSVDGNIESEWRATASPATLRIDSGDAAADYDYIYLLFNYNNLPTSVKIYTSASPSSGYGAILNNYDGTVATTLTAIASPSSRIISVTSSANFNVGNTIQLYDGVKTTKKFLVIGVGTGYIELDRYPLAYAIGGTVTVYPAAEIIAAVGAGESKRYIQLVITASSPHLLEAHAFSVNYTFDNNALPLNPFPVDEARNTGSIARSLSNYGIGKMHTGPNYSRYSLGIGRLGRDGASIISWLEKQGRFGILMDDGQWKEVMLAGDIAKTRRLSSDADIVSYAMQLTVEEV